MPLFVKSFSKKIGHCLVIPLYSCQWPPDNFVNTLAVVLGFFFCSEWEHWHVYLTFSHKATPATLQLPYEGTKQVFILSNIVSWNFNSTILKEIECQIFYNVMYLNCCQKWMLRKCLGEGTVLEHNSKLVRDIISNYILPIQAERDHIKGRKIVPVEHCWCQSH